MEKESAANERQNGGKKSRHLWKVWVAGIYKRKLMSWS